MKHVGYFLIGIGVLTMLCYCVYLPVYAFMVDVRTFSFQVLRIISVFIGVFALITLVKVITAVGEITYTVFLKNKNPEKHDQD